MKFSLPVLLLVGVIGTSEAHYLNTQLAQLNARSAVESLSDSSESDDDALAQTRDDVFADDDGIIDALTPPKGNCDPRLWLDRREMEWQMDQFSRHFDIKNYNNAMKIASELHIKPPRAHAWELNDAAFSFPRVRRYDEVQQNMDMLEHFQDNLNTNISNLVNVENFIRVGKTVTSNFSYKYHEGEYDNPANHDPREEAEIKANGG